MTVETPSTPPEKPRPPDPPVDMPVLVNAPTGWLLPAAVLYSRTGIDTGGGVTSDNRVGLGDVAEFGVSTLDDIRAQQAGASEPQHIQPYFAATFRMGLEENRLFGGQPGVVLGFEKSFSTSDGDFKTQIAELTLVASKHFGARTAIHLGAAFWDAQLEGGTIAQPIHLYGGNLVRQIKPFGGLDFRPFDRSEIMVDVSWAPLFDYAAPSIALRPELAWGVRYRIAEWAYLESGVRVPDIGDANLLNAQIFGRVTFTSWALRHAIDDLK